MTATRSTKSPFQTTGLAIAVLVAVCLNAGNADAAKTTTDPTQFYLIGVGPGDPDLITLRAIETMKGADVVYCMESIAEKFSRYLVGKEVIHGYWRLFPYYGQDPTELDGEERLECERIALRRNEFIAKVRQAIAAGRTVAVVDHGDPLIYGPWAWCLEEFEDLGPIVVPGLSCFNAANAALGRGITTSDKTKSVILSAADWPGKTDTIDKLAIPQSTMVLFTMRAEFKEFIEKLSVNYPPETPVAVVKYAGYAGKQEVVQATLGTILERVESDALPFEYLIYVGEFLTHRYHKSK